MKALSLKVKVILLGILPAILLTLSLAGVTIYQVRQLGWQQVENVRKNALLDKETELKNYVDMAVSSIRSVYESAAANNPRAQEQSKAILRQLAFGADGYFFVYRYDGLLLVNRPKPELEGKDVANLKDAQGSLFIREMLDRARQGGGYTTYLWDKPSKGRAVKKMSYTVALDKWQWVIGTGFYIDDIDDVVQGVEQQVTQDVRHTIFLILIVAAVMLTLIMLASLMVARNITHLYRIVSKVRAAADTVSAAANEFAQGSADLAQRTEEQASALEETVASTEELTSTVKQSAENAAQANQLAANARDQAEQGGKVVNRAVQAMEAINASSRKIADIIRVIDEIAFQTNLLALNAAVEAARAGEQGRGFAVVAGEVRKLAQRSAEAAKEIKTLIHDSVSKVAEGSQLVETSGQTLHEILAAVQRVSGIVAEIAAASREQASGIGQVNKAITQMDQVTQQNAALVEETAAASRSLEEQALELKRLMGFFGLDKQPSSESALEAQPLGQPLPVERRSTTRPWTAPAQALTSKPHPAQAAAEKKAAVANATEWEKF